MKNLLAKYSPNKPSAMRKLILVITFLWTACSATQPSCPTCPPPVVTTDTVHVPGPTVYVHDTLIYSYYFRDTVPIAPKFDTAGYLLPDPVDNWAVMQGILNAGQRLPLGRYKYPYSKTLIVASFNGTGFSNSWCDIEGPARAKNTTQGYTAQLYPTFTNAPAIILQQCKGCTINNVEFHGGYHFPDKLTQLQIDTLPFAAWAGSYGPTDGYFAVNIDPFCDSSNFTGKFRRYAGLHQYYVNTGGSGSTDVKITGSLFQDFEGGVLVTGGMNNNGEEIDVDDNQFVDLLVCEASTQAQSKQNHFNNNMAWGQIRTVLDGVHFGFPHGDAATLPFVNGLNGAGIVMDLVEGDTRSYSFNARDIFFEGLFKLGFTGADNSRGAGIHFTDCQINFQNGGPSPSSWYTGGGLLCTGCDLSYYNGGNGPRRIVLNDIGDLFIGGMMSGPPIVVQGEAETPMATLVDVGMFYDYSLGGTLSGSNWDSVTGGYLALVRINRSAFTGYYLTSDTAGLTTWMPILTEMLEPIDSASLYLPESATLNSQTVLGYVSRPPSGDTVFLSFMGADIPDSTVLSIYPARIKKQ